MFTWYCALECSHLYLLRHIQTCASLLTVSSAWSLAYASGLHLVSPLGVRPLFSYNLSHLPLNSHFGDPRCSKKKKKEILHAAGSRQDCITQAPQHSKVLGRQVLVEPSPLSPVFTNPQQNLGHINDPFTTLETC